MSEAIYEIALDLHSTMSQASLAVKQGDTDRKVYISLREDGKPYRIERGAFAVFSTITPEGKVIEDNCIVEDNKIVYGFTEVLTASVGVMDVEIRLYDVNSKHIISPVFTLIVDPRAAVGDKVKEATDSFTSLDGMYNKLNAVANEVQTKLDNGEFVGETGSPAGFGAVTADAVSLSPGTPPTVSIETSGPDTAKNFKFSFGIPTPSDLDFKVDPIFANNSWDTIAKVARYGDPSKYWKVGDYKMLNLCKLSTASKLIDIIDEEALKKALNYRSGEYNIFINFYEDGAGAEKWEHFDLFIATKESGWTPTEAEEGEYVYREEYTSIPRDENYYPLLKCGIRYNVKYGSPMYDWYDNCSQHSLSYQNGEYPLQIIGFNHDKVTDPYNYGKQKAGMTLQLGASRNVYGDDIASLPIIPIDGLMTSNGYYKAPNDVKEDFSNGATNWADSGFRKAIQSIFDNTEIEPYIVNVQKLTLKYYRSSSYWSDTLLTEDKVFLPSEYEMFGDQIFAPFKEGEQYELYEDGYSKFMWSQGLLDSPTGTVMRLWLRSGYGKQVNEIKGDSNYSCNIYLLVNSFNPISVGYSPSYATNGNGMIAPCICL